MQEAKEIEAANKMCSFSKKDRQDQSLKMYNLMKEEKNIWLALEECKCYVKREGVAKNAIQYMLEKFERKKNVSFIQKIHREASN